MFGCVVGGEGVVVLGFSGGVSGSVQGCGRSGGGGAVDQKSSLHGAGRPSSFILPFSPAAAAFLLRRLRRRALGLAVLTAGGLAAPGGAVAQSWGAVEVVLVVQAVGGVVLCVLQAGDQTLVLIPELAAHQGRLAHHHHVLDRQVKGTLGDVHAAGRTQHVACSICSIRNENRTEK